MQHRACMLICCAMALLAACGTPATPRADAPPATGPTDAASTANTSSADAPASTSGTLTVFAAASLTEALGEIGAAFEAAYPGASISFNFAGSHQLARQIDQGAPADVFASANATQINVLIDRGHVRAGTQRTFARNRLVVIYPADNPAGIATLDDLARPGLTLDLAARDVPAGQYALDFLDNATRHPDYGASFRESVLANVVSYEENVRSVLTKVSLGEVDAGIVYASDISRNAASKIGRLNIPDDLNVIAPYPIAPIATSPNAALAEQFIAYVLGEDAQAVLATYGFAAP